MLDGLTKIIGKCFYSALNLFQSRTSDSCQRLTIELKQSFCNHGLIAAFQRFRPAQCSLSLHCKMVSLVQPLTRATFGAIVVIR